MRQGSFHGSVLHLFMAALILSLLSIACGARQPSVARESPTPTPRVTVSWIGGANWSPRQSDRSAHQAASREESSRLYARTAATAHGLTEPVVQTSAFVGPEAGLGSGGNAGMAVQVLLLLLLIGVLLYALSPVIGISKLLLWILVGIAVGVGFGLLLVNVL